MRKSKIHKGFKMKTEESQTNLKEEIRENCTQTQLYPDIREIYRHKLIY